MRLYGGSPSGRDIKKALFSLQKYGLLECEISSKNKARYRIPQSVEAWANHPQSKCGRITHVGESPTLAKTENGPISTPEKKANRPVFDSASDEENSNNPKINQTLGVIDGMLEVWAKHPRSECGRITHGQGVGETPTVEPPFPPRPPYPLFNLKNNAETESRRGRARCRLCDLPGNRVLDLRSKCEELGFDWTEISHEAYTRFNRAVEQITEKQASVIVRSFEEEKKRREHD